MKTQKFTIEVTSITGIDLIDSENLENHLNGLVNGRWFSVREE